jgi:hypothetical protein
VPAAEDCEPHSGRLRSHMEEKIIEGRGRKVDDFRLCSERYLGPVGKSEALVGVQLVSVQKRSIRGAEVNKVAFSCRVGDVQRRMLLGDHPIVKNNVILRRPADADCPCCALSSPLVQFDDPRLECLGLSQVLLHLVKEIRLVEGFGAELEDHNPVKDPLCLLNEKPGGVSLDEALAGHLAAEGEIVGELLVSELPGDVRVIDALELSEASHKLQGDPLFFFIGPGDDRRASEADRRVLPGECGWQEKGEDSPVVGLKRAPAGRSDEGATLAEVFSLSLDPIRQPALGEFGPEVMGDSDMFSSILDGHTAFEPFVAW